ncbi:MAG: PrgI family protein [Candidatus Berkelbacteria bacterium]|nr:PrgI family protein [Candidatus Berkelbacteria bacterium]
MPRRYLVPQYIEMADRIVGPLTLIQFLYLLVGGILVYLFWNVFDKIIAIPLSILVGPIFLALAFLKINDQPFPRMVIAGIAYFLSPKDRIWKKTKENIAPVTTKKPLIKQGAVPKIIYEKEAKSQLDRLASVVNSEGWVAKPENEVMPAPDLKSRVKSHPEIRPERTKIASEKIKEII